VPKDGLGRTHRESARCCSVVDNLEQVIDAAPDLADLVESCRNLRILTTSRELMRVRGEVEYAVPPLAERDAVELFAAAVLDCLGRHHRSAMPPP
jgi:predicted ATPase